MKIFSLQLTYQDFLSNKKSIVGCSIGKYTIVERIGQGGFGTVYKGIDEEFRRQIAAKVIDLKTIEQEKNPNIKEMRRRFAKSEAELMSFCKSLHVVKCYDVFENPDLRIIILQYCNGGSLQDILQNQKGNVLPEDEAIDYIKQIIFGLSEIHKHKIIHRDMKTDNIMVHNGVLKIADFGFSKMLKQAISVTGSCVGTLATMAPQVIKRQSYGQKADLWSLGIILYEMLFGKLPYDECEGSEMYQSIMKKEIFSGLLGKISPNVLNLLQRLLTKDQKSRISWEQLVSHEALQPKEHIPGNYRISRNISSIFVYDVEDVQEDSYLLNIQKICKMSQHSNEKCGVKWLSHEQLKKKKLISEKQAENFRQVKKIYLQCVKSQFLFKSIYKPIKEIQNDQSLVKLEILYLIICRCFFNVRQAEEQLQDTEHQICVGLFQTVQQLFTSIKHQKKEGFEKYYNQKHKISNSISNTWEKMFNTQEKEQKKMFLKGIEGQDFSKGTQIHFTHQLIQKNIKALSKADKKLTSYLKNYEQINFICLNDLGNKKFEEKVQEFVC